MDSQPDESRPGARAPLKRRKQSSRGLAPELGTGPRWKVRLELEPAEIARVYRQGLARGAEVRRVDQHEWRPLLTAPELRAALERPPSDPNLGPTLTLTRTTHSLAISDPTLAALLLERRPAHRSASAPPPPPPSVVTASTLFVRLPQDTIPDSEITVPLPTRALPAEPFEPFESFEPPRVLHASRLELAVAAALSVVATLLVMLVAQRALHWGEARAPIAEPVQSVVPDRASLTSPPIVEPVRASFPVVAVHDLPVERMTLASASAVRGSSAPRQRVAAARSEFARALSRAAASARNCGAGPVQAQVVATFAPSGVPRAVHFGAAAPPAALRSCVLAAVARARVAPFEGPPVTVAKALRW